jgi:arsenate reductase
MTNGKKRVLVLCTGNSCRSQMAEGWINHLLGATWEAHSAGTHPAPSVHPLAVRAMAEVGVDISKAAPENVRAHLDEPWDLVVTVCDSARETCPTFPRPVPKIHVSFDDPAAAEGTEEERMPVFRRVRDEIHGRLLPEIRERVPTASG